MKLSEYFSQERGLLSKLAREIGAYPPDVSRWASGKRPVPVRYGAAIELATGGAVTRRDLRPDDWQQIWPDLERRTRSRRK